MRFPRHLARTGGTSARPAPMGQRRRPSLTPESPLPNPSKSGKRVRTRGPRRAAEQRHPARPGRHPCRSSAKTVARPQHGHHSPGHGRGCGAPSAARRLLQGLRLIAPPLGAGVLAACGLSPLVAGDAATFALAAGLLALIRHREERPQPSQHEELGARITAAADGLTRRSV